MYAPKWRFCSVYSPKDYICMETINQAMDQTQLSSFYVRVNDLQGSTSRPPFTDDAIGRLLYGLFSVQFKNREAEGRRFLLAYAEFSKRHFTFLYDWETLSTLFSKWRRDVNYFSRLEEFSTKFKKVALPRNVWDELIFYTFEDTKKEGYRVIHFVLLETILKEALAQKQNLAELPLKVLRHLQFSENELKQLKTDRERKRVAMGSLGIIPGLFFVLLEKGLNPSDFYPILSQYTTNSATPLFNFNRSTRKFLKELAKKINLTFFPHADSLSLNTLLYVFENNPALFAKLDLRNMNIESQNQWVKEMFADFRVPEFVIWNLFSRKTHLSEENFLWCAEIVAGKSPKSIKVKPYKVSNKMAGLLYQLQQKEMEVDEAILHVGLMAQGLTENQAASLRGAIRAYYHFDFFIEAAATLFRRGMTSQDFRIIWDYLLYLKQERVILPDLRTCNLSRLNEEIEVWHAEKKLKRRNRSLPKAGTKLFKLNLENEQSIVIQQINSELELYREGRAHKHCVYSYMWDVFYRRTFIFSLKLRSPEGQRRLLTIEVRDSKIYQIRGLFNRQPTPEEMNWVQRWANSASLSIMGHVA